MMLLFSFMMVLASAEWNWQSFNQTFDFSSPSPPNCNNTICCAGQISAPNFEIIDSVQDGDLVTSFLSELPPGFALSSINISLCGAYNLSSTQGDTKISVLIGDTAIQTEYSIPNQNCSSCHACHCYNCHSWVNIPAQNSIASWWTGYDYQNPNILTFMVTQNTIALSAVTLHFLALDINPVIHSFSPPSLALKSDRKGIDIRGQNFLYSLHYLCEWTSSTVNDTTSGYLFNETNVYCPMNFLDSITKTTELSLKVYPDTKLLGNLVFPESIGPFSYLVYRQPKISHFLPSWGDPDGGTLITVMGSHFYNTKKIYCRFGFERVKAQWINSSAVSCVAPRMNGTSVVPLEVSQNGYDWTSNNKTFSYGGFVPIGPPNWLATHLWVIVVATLGFVLLLSIVILLVLYKTRSDPDKTYTRVMNEIDPSALIPREELQMKEKIGRGSFGDVYRGTWRYSEVAIKTIVVPSQELLSEITREAQLMLKMRHPNITQLMGVAIDQEEICIVTEFIARGSLFRILHLKNVRIEFEHIRKFALDCCKGMAYIHGSMIIHRDLKCSNLLVDKDWNVKVSDFGLSRSVADTGNTMTACGTPCWAAPEVLRNMSYSFAADVYSFGVCLWEMLTREYPYDGRPPYQVVIAVATQGLKLQTPENIPSCFAEILESCWREAEERPTFGELITILANGNIPAPRSPYPRVKGGGSLRVGQTRKGVEDAKIYRQSKSHHEEGGPSLLSPDAAEERSSGSEDASEFSQSVDSRRHTTIDLDVSETASLLTAIDGSSVQ
eukprot:TRINITY_DN6566_c0_g1_i1.p1 TRINITY_DN6566_c0_g1~~TRINITY_DN6566_c0_g1_i1.p1  ORF type:complete len:780 (+),score=135.33 TRINITY_DN6566_c0_g1_i1:51-2390(+)